jgi:asparagine synthase (glutamine-hydrolysing)
MCGIAGKLVFDSTQKVKQEEIQNMCNTLVHRGPDDEGIYLGGCIGLGHRRLSIIDLNSGKQPISNEDGTIWTILNGEIYNYVELKQLLISQGHQFSTETDTEVIVHLYEEVGEEFLSSLRGMFAIALWDDRKKKLLLARDRLGKKPIFYSIIPGKTLLFGSEIKAILADPAVKRELNIEALDAYLALLYVPSPLTMFKGIHKLPAGHLLTCSDEKVTMREFWDLQYEPTTFSRESDAAEKLEAIFEESVKIRLRSDVPIGAFLSGGVDSSSVVMMMASSLTRPVVTCAVGFDEGEYNELPYAQEVAEHLKCDHHQHIIQPNVVDLLPRLVEFFDEPFGDSSAVPTYYVSQMTRRYATVALSGDGGDEVFAGYSRHYLQQLECRLRQILLGSVGASIVSSMASWLPEIRGKATLAKLRMSPQQAYAEKHSHLLFNGNVKQRLYSDELHEACSFYDVSAVFRSYYNRCNAQDPLDKALYVDMKTYLADDILVKVDRMSMAHGLEVRAPLLDHKLIEFTATLPPSLKLRGGTTKYLLKQIMRNRLPANVFTRKKQGFSMPIGEWLRGSLKEIVEASLFSSAAQSRGLFKAALVRSLWEEHVSRRADNSHQIWMLLMFELWCQSYLDGISWQGE